MKIVNGKNYLSVDEGSKILGVTYKTFQKYLKLGKIRRRTEGGWETKKINIEMITFPSSGFRYCNAEQVEDLAAEFYPGYIRQFSPK